MSFRLAAVSRLEGSLQFLEEALTWITFLPERETIEFAGLAGHVDQWIDLSSRIQEGSTFSPICRFELETIDGGETVKPVRK